MSGQEVHGFKMSSGEEILFIGVGTGKLTVLTNAPDTVRDLVEHDPFGHMIRHPYVVLHQYDGSVQLKRWPRFAAGGTCEEVFVPDKDVTFQLVPHELDQGVVARYLDIINPPPPSEPTKHYEEFMGA